MRALNVIRLYAVAVLALVLVGGMVLKPGRPRVAERSPAPPEQQAPAPGAERFLTAGF